jgi:hypothetical protein
VRGFGRESHTILTENHSSVVRVGLQDERCPVARQAVPESRIRPIDVGRTEHALDGLAEIRCQPALRHVAGRPLLERLDGDLCAALSRRQDDGNQRITFLESPEQLSAVDSRQRQVRQHEIGHVPLDFGQRLLAVRGVDHVPTRMLFEKAPDESAVRCRIVNHSKR